RVLPEVERKPQMSAHRRRTRVCWTLLAAGLAASSAAADVAVEQIRVPTYRGVEAFLVEAPGAARSAARRVNADLAGKDGAAPGPTGGYEVTSTVIVRAGAARAGRAGRERGPGGEGGGGAGAEGGGRGGGRGGRGCGGGGGRAGGGGGVRVGAGVGEGGGGERARGGGGGGRAAGGGGGDRGVRGRARA